MPKTVWVIDDDKGILEVTQIILQEAGYNVVLLDGENALNTQLEIGKIPDVILLDILISGADGRDIARKLKSEKKTQTIPILLMSADTNIQEKYNDTIVDGYIKKPFDINDLEKKVNEFANK